MKAITVIIAIVSLIQFIKSAAINLQELQNINTKTTFKFRLDYVEFPPSRRDQIFDYGTVRSRKFNRTTHVIDGYYDILVPVTDDMVLNVYMYTWQGNEYRKLGERTIPKVCSAMQNETMFVPDVIRQTNVNPNFTCPFQPMRIILYNLTLPELPSFYVVGDRFRVNMTVLHTNETILAKYAAYIVKET